MKGVRQTLNGREVARRLMADALLPSIQVQVKRIQREIATPLNEAVSGFFPDLASYMGKPVDLVDQLGTDAGSLGSWKPLTPVYIKRKGNDNFWLFTGGMAGAQLQGVAVRILKKARDIRVSKTGKLYLTKKQRAKRLQDMALIPTLRNLNGVDVFGPVQVKVGEESLGLMQFKPGDRPLTATSVHLRVRLWTRWARGQLANPDRAMFDQGSIDQSTLYKLSNFRDIHPGYYRPLVKPLMSYYGLLKLPKLLEQVARELA